MTVFSFGHLTIASSAWLLSRSGATAKVYFCSCHLIHFIFIPPAASHVCTMLVGVGS